MMIEWV